MPEPLQSWINQYGALQVLGGLAGAVLLLILMLFAAWKLGVRRGKALAYESFAAEYDLGAEMDPEIQVVEDEVLLEEDTPLVPHTPETPAEKPGVVAALGVAWNHVTHREPAAETEGTAADAEIGPDDPTPILAMAPAAAGESTGPRRAVSVPAHESDRSGRQSEETLKRVTAQQIEADAKLKPPRASDVASNPILPEGEVKIRCIGCSKKMKASGPKFAKQRRCPFCKAEPFRYVIAD
jgi:hypothetical protein